LAISAGWPIEWPVEIHCGFEIDRDLNAAINLKNTGLLPEFQACGLDVKPEAIQVVEVEAGSVVNVS